MILLSGNSSNGVRNTFAIVNSVVKAMLKGVFLFLFFLFPFFSIAQDTADSEKEPLDTFDFDLTKFRGKGAYDFVRKKSAVTQSYYQVSLPTGEWQFTDDKDVLRVRGNYKIKETDAIKTGKWEYYDTEGELLMSEEIPKGKTPPVYIRPFAMKTTDGFDIIDFNDGGVLEMNHYETPKPVYAGPTSYSIGLTHDSLYENNYDTLIAMDKRNPDTWLVEEQKPKPLKEDLNLIKNSSFEKTDGKLKISGAQIKNHVTDWIASAGTPDYHRVSKGYAIDGGAFVGCRFYTELRADIEFISTELKQPLEAGQLYSVKVFVKLKGDCFFGVNALGVLLSDEIPNENDLINGEIKPTLKHNGGSLLNYKTKWMQLSCNYKALGNETYITLGSFANADSMQKVRLKGSTLEAYYFFDNIQLFAIEDEDECPCTIGEGKKIAPPPPPPVLETGKSFVIKNIFFENDEWDLLPASFTSLDSLYDLLKTGNFKKIEISGHTSSTGSKERNIFLSKNRAEAVKEYLVDKGLEEGMFECKGYGPAKPIADNSTVEGQAENRRVEFKILE